MASPYQQQARNRKFIYLGLIIALFAATYVWRHHGVGVGRWRVSGVEEVAHQLGVREDARGEPDLSGSVVRLSLIGSRGLATTILWSSAIEKQKKNQWNELEIVVRSLTKLQPHFISPWLFQSWNLAYNVSVESDRIADKYFYITRGILLLGEGERQNRDNPELRFNMGFYTSNKIHMNDETNVIRSLLQLSMIPPNQRDPARFRNEDGPQNVDWAEFEKQCGQRLKVEPAELRKNIADWRQNVRWNDFLQFCKTHPELTTSTFHKDPGINWQEFENFCKDHPQLVRRLRQGIRRDTKYDLLIRQFTCDSAEKVIEFLEDNFGVPSVWESVTAAAPGAWRLDPEPRKKELAERFPALPPRHNPAPPQRLFDPRALTDEDPLDDDVDCHRISRAWYSYSQEPVPDPGEFPGQMGPFEDPRHQRRPKQIAAVIFRSYPARSQSYLGERLQQEGWFDEEGWEVPDWFKDRDDDRSRQAQPVVVGAGVKWSLRAWSDAFDMWRRYGLDNKLLFRSREEERNKRQEAAEFGRKFNLAPGTRPDQSKFRIEDMDAVTAEQFKSFVYLWEYQFNRDRLTNFPHHYASAEAEAKEETVQARKTFYLADRLRLTGSSQEALDMLDRPEGIRNWRDNVLLKNPEFRHDQQTQEETAELHITYLNLFYELHGSAVRRTLCERLGMLALAAQSLAGGGSPALAGQWYPYFTLRRPYPDLDCVAGPFSGADRDGVPLIDPSLMRIAEQRKMERQPLQARPGASSQPASSGARTGP